VHMQVDGKVEQLRMVGTSGQGGVQIADQAEQVVATSAY
jgi:hypothetical protein